MGRQRATDQRNNCDVKMPGPASPLIEAGHNTRVGLWQEIFLKIRKKMCDESGRQKKRNLTPGQELALKSLGRKVAKVEIVIMEADKGKKFVVCDQATYRAMALDHVSKDVRVSKEEIAAHQRILTSTASQHGECLWDWPAAVTLQLRSLHGQCWISGRRSTYDEDPAKDSQASNNNRSPSV